MLREALSLGRAPLLPEEPDDGWLAEVRRAHAHRMHRGLVEAAAKVAGLPDGDAAHWAGAALDCDPLDESAWLALLRGHEASGQHADGVRAYERCRRLYAAELGCAPGAGLQEAYVRLLRGAHEDDGELSLLFDAVVRLHAACRARRSRSDRGPPSGTSWSCTGCCTGPGAVNPSSEPSAPDPFRWCRLRHTALPRAAPSRHARCDLPLDQSLRGACP